MKTYFTLLLTTLAAASTQRPLIKADYPSPYAVLGLQDDADLIEVKKTYRQLSKERHPDKAHINGMTQEEATDAFKELSAAYEAIKSSGSTDFYAENEHTERQHSFKNEKLQDWEWKALLELACWGQVIRATAKAESWLTAKPLEPSSEDIIFYYAKKHSIDLAAIFNIFRPETQIIIALKAIRDNRLSLADLPSELQNNDEIQYAANHPFLDAGYQKIDGMKKLIGLEESNDHKYSELAVGQEKPILGCIKPTKETVGKIFSTFPLNIQVVMALDLIKSNTVSYDVLPSNIKQNMDVKLITTNEMLYTALNFPLFSSLSIGMLSKATCALLAVEEGPIPKAVAAVSFPCLLASSFFKKSLVKDVEEIQEGCLKNKVS